MDLADFFVELLKAANTSRDNDRSIVGESPMEARLSRFWLWAQAALALVVIGCAVWYWSH